MKKVFLENLPKWGKGFNAREGTINWNESVGHKVRFIYDDIEGEIEIIKIEGFYLTLKYNDTTFDMKYTHLKDCHIGRFIGKVTKDFRVKIGDTFKNDKRDLVVIDRKYKTIKSGQETKIYKYKCNKCGWTEGWLEESNLLKGIGCSCCDGKTLVEGINDIPSTTLWLIKYFQGGYEEARKYTKSCSKTIHSVCPDCGRIHKKKVSINSIYTNKGISCSCGDGKSYPEKFVYGLLEQLKIEFTPEVTKSIFEWCKNYRYDFYLLDHNCIIETHGRQHYEKSFYTIKKGRTLEEEKENDKLKKEYALANGIEHYIVLDCRKSELEWMKNSILNSELNNLFDLSNIDWNKCEEFALSNLVKYACELKRDNPDLTSKEIGKIIKIAAGNVIKYLKKGTELGWCNYNAEYEQDKGRKKSVVIKKENAKSVEVFKDGESLGVFKSVDDLVEKSEELLGVKLYRRNVYDTLNPKHERYKKPYKKYHFKEK